MLANFALLLLGIGVVGQSALLGANAFEAVVDVPNWREPASLRAYRGFIRHRNAGHFYRVLSPLTIVALVLALALGWSGLALRDVLVGVALATAVAAEGFTVAYFFPRNRRLFLAPEEEDPGPRSRALVEEWARANPVRVAVVLVGVAAGLIAFAASAAPVLTGR
jgi:hypothetical protein